VKRLAARIGLAALSVLLVLGTAEAALRILGVGEVMTYQPDPRFGYELRPSQHVSTYGHVIAINSLGLRGPELSEPKPPGTLRVLFVGDSVTYGGGRVAEAELFCRRVESMATAEGLRLEVVNVSAPGWSPQNWSAWLEAHGMLDADAVLAVIPAIDLRRPFATVDQVGVVDHAPPLRLGTLWLKVRQLRLPRIPFTDESLEKNLAAVRELRDRFPNIPFFAAFVESRPSADAGSQPSAWGPYEALFPDAIDLRKALAPADFIDDVHLSVSGHATVAQGIWVGLAPRLRELLAAGAARPL
jgi:hypothetical protein